MSESQALNLFFSIGMAPLFQGFSYLRSYKPPYSQQVSTESSLAIVLESERRLQLQVEAFWTISLRPWVAGLVKLICYMCVHQWTPSFQWLEDLPSRFGASFFTYPSYILGAFGFGLFFSGFWLPQP